MILHERRFRKSYETDRLILKIVDESAVEEVLQFLNAGAQIFEEYESKKPADFYTKSTQRKLLRSDYTLALQKGGVRFWVYRKSNPSEVIGTVSFSFFKGSPFKSIMIGYKLLPQYWHQGYATEAIGMCLEIVPAVMDVHRIEAFVLPENHASQAVLERLDFRLEGTAYACLEVKGVRRDHLQYSYTCN